MKTDYGGLNVKSAKEQLQAIYGAKDFLRGNQQEAPDMYGYYQKQIDDLTQEEDELNSWLGENEGKDEDYGGGNYYDSISGEEAEHFNDDLYGGKKKAHTDYVAQSYDEDYYEPDIDNDKADLYNQNRSTEKAVKAGDEDDELSRRIEREWYEDEDYGNGAKKENASSGVNALKSGLEAKIDDESGEPYYIKPDGTKVPSKVYYNSDTDSYYYGPDLDYLAEEQKTAENARAQGETSEQATQNSEGLTGSIHTDPDSGESYHIAADGTMTPMSEMENPAAEEPQTAAADKDYSAVITAQDYSEKSQAVTDGRNGSLYDYINNIGGTRERIYNELGTENNWYGKYEQMSTEEVGTYNYLCATEGTENADKYLRSLGNTLNQRIGTQVAESSKGNTGAQVMYGFYTGIDRSLSNVSRIIPGNEDYKSAHEYAKELVRKDLKESGNNAFAQVAFDVLDGVGFAVPSIVASYMTGGLLASAGVGANTARTVGALLGNAGNTALSAGEVYRGLKEQGYSDAQAGLYAVSSAAVNGTLQALIGGIPGLSVEKGVVSNAINGINSAILQAGARIGVNALSQGTTQALQSVVSDLLSQAILDDKSQVDWEEALYQGVLGTLTGGLTTAALEAGKGIGKGLDAAEGKLGQWDAERNKSGALDPYAKQSSDSVSKVSETKPNPEGYVGSSGDTSIKPYFTSRPKYGSNQVDDVWNSHVDSETGTVTDPSGARIVWDRTKLRNGQWDMGHKPSHKYSDMHSKYMNGEINLDEFLKWYRNPNNYRPELPKTNRSHLYESNHK